ncbi:hypothetical protein LXL04_013729 [Taraxacum kok-saghyz]
MSNQAATITKFSRRAPMRPFRGRTVSLSESPLRLGVCFSSTTRFSCHLAIGGFLCLLRTHRSQLSVFRPKVDEISLLTVNSSSFSPDSVGGYMVAFAGRKYAARSIPAFVANSTYIVTSFTLVMEFQKGRLQNLYWKRDWCSSCSGKSNFVCLNNQDCAIRTNSCKNIGGTVDCSVGIQLAFSGTDKDETVFNSWYEVKNLRQYSLFGLYKNLKDSLTGQYNSFF